METITDLDGKLAIKSTMIMSDQPERNVAYYPTGVRTRDYPHLVGETVEYDDWQGAYYIPTTGAYIRPKDGKDTRPIKTETEPIPPPGRGGKLWEWRWSMGQWRKGPRW